MTARSRAAKAIVLRDLLIFQIKLFLDGIKDIVLMPASIIAAGLDVVVPGEKPGRLFYSVLRFGEKFDRWLSLFSAASTADAHNGGLFGASRAGSNSLLGEIEAMILGHEEPRTPRKRRAA